MNNRIYVGNLVYEVDADALANFFEQAGRVVRARVVYTEDGKRSKGYGFVYFADEEDAGKAIKMFNDSFMHGRRIKVAYVHNKPEEAAGEKPK